MSFQPSLCFVLFSATLSATQHPDALCPVPADATAADFETQASRLEVKHSAAVRLEAAKWLIARAESSHAALAVPVLERCLKTDPDAEVRNAAVQARAMIAAKRKEPCPLAVVEAMLDKDLSVSQNASACGELFKTFSSGSVEVLLRCAKADPFAAAVSRCLLALAAKTKGLLKRSSWRRTTRAFRFGTALTSPCSKRRTTFRSN